MEAPDVMQMAADHAAKAEEFIAAGSPSSARLHIEHSKLLVTMAREVRIGNSRSRAYQGLVFKPVVIAEAPLPLEAGDGVREFEDVPDRPELAGSERQDEALRLSELPSGADGVWSWERIAAHLGYASPDSAREAARSARLRRDVPVASELGGSEPQ